MTSGLRFQLGSGFHVLMALSVSFLLCPRIAYARIFEGYPDALICRAPGIVGVAYISGLKSDKSAVYATFGEAYFTVTPDGVVHREGAKDCDGKTLEQLEKAGQTRDFK